MSSDTVPERKNWSRCLFCSLRCTFGIGEAGPDSYVPTIPDDPDSGLCVRGMVIGDLISMVRRGTVLDAREADDWVPSHQATTMAKEALGACSGIDIVVDGMHKAELLQLAAQLARESSGRIRSFVSVPGEDVLLLQNVWASDATVSPITAVETADCILVIGDPFSSYPRSALPLLRFRRAQPRAPLIVIDSVAQRTGMFGTHRIMVAPQAIHRAVARFATLGTEGVERPRFENGVVQETIDEAVNVFNRSARPVIVIGSTPGRGIEWPQAGFVAGCIARSRDAALVVLTQYGNAAGATRFLSSNALLPVGDLMDESPESRGIILIGEDLLCIPPHPMVESYVRSAGLVVQISLVPSRQFPGIHFPGMAFAEEAGHILSDTGAWEFVPSAIPAPRGVRPISGVLAEIATGKPVSASLWDEQELPGPRELAAPELTFDGQGSVGEQGLLGVMMGDPQQFIGGAFTATSRFLAERAGLPKVAVSRQVSEKLRVGEGDEIILATDYNECKAEVRLADGQHAGCLAVAAGNQAVRRMFPFELVDGLAVAKPTQMEVSSSRGSTE